MTNHNLNDSINKIIFKNHLIQKVKKHLLKNKSLEENLQFYLILNQIKLNEKVDKSF